MRTMTKSINPSRLAFIDHFHIHAFSFNLADQKNSIPYRTFQKDHRSLNHDERDSRSLAIVLRLSFLFYRNNFHSVFLPPFQCIFSVVPCSAVVQSLNLGFIQFFKLSWQWKLCQIQASTVYTSLQGDSHFHSCNQSLLNSYHVYIVFVILGTLGQHLMPKNCIGRARIRRASLYLDIFYCL